MGNCCNADCFCPWYSKRDGESSQRALELKRRKWRHWGKEKVREENKMK